MGIKIKTSRSDRIFYIVSCVLLGLLLLLVAYPLLFVLAASFSSADAVNAGEVFIFPKGFNLDGYKAVFEYPRIWTAYGNTIFYTAVGTVINIVMVMLVAFPLSRHKLKGRGIFMFIFTFTMYFSGGLIPTYLLINDLHLINTRWAMLLPGALSVYNMIVARTFIQNNIPNELYEAASIDGCSDFRYFLKIVLPLSKALIAVIALFSAVGHWNTYFNAMIYLNDPELMPLQIILREILIMNQVDFSTVSDPELYIQMANTAVVLKFSLIVVATVPILCAYPFAQKYFAKGVMVGSLKG